MAGPIYQPSFACGDQVPRWDGLSWTSTLMPGGAIGVLLKSNRPLSCSHADSFGFSRDPLRRLRVSSAWKRILHQSCIGNSRAVLTMPEV